MTDPALYLAAAQDSLTLAEQGVIEQAALVADLRAEVAGLFADKAALLVRVAELEALLPKPEPEPVALIGSSTETPFPIPVPAMAAYRHYFQSGDWTGTKQPTFTSETALKRAYDLYGVRNVSVSFKPGWTAAKAARFFESCPTDLRLWVTFFHEHDGNLRDGSLKYADYLKGCHDLADLAHEHGHLFGPIHNGSNRRDGATGPWGYWPAQWAAGEAPLEVCDFWGFDTYAETYQDPATRLAPVLAYAETHGLPLLVGETGAPAGPQQGPWAALMRAWCLEHTALACWWNNQFTGKPDYRLCADAAKAWLGT